MSTYYGRPQSVHLYFAAFIEQTPHIRELVGVVVLGIVAAASSGG